MATIKFRMIVEVTYDAEDANPQELKDNLENIIDYAMGNGMFTGGSVATVNDWSTTIEEVKPAITEAKTEGEGASVDINDSQDYFCVGADGNIWILGNHGDYEAAEDTAKSLGVDVIWMFGEQTAADWRVKLATGTPETAINQKGWITITSDDGQYLYVERDGAPGQIHIKAEDEGFVTDIWSDGDEPVCVAGTSANFTELEPE